MRKKIFLILLLIPLFSFSQNAQTLIDGLMNELKNNPDAKKTATIYSDLTWYYSNISIDSALHYGKKAIESSKKIGDSTLLAQVYSDNGAAFFRKGDYANSKLNYLNAYKIRKSRKDYAGMAKVNANLASIYNKEGNKKLALKTYLEAIEYFEKIGNTAAAALTKANVGFLLHETRNYPKAMSYLKEAIAYQEKNKIESGLCTSYLTLGNVYLKLKDTIHAMDAYSKSVVFSKKTDNKISLASALVNIGSVKSKQKKEDETKALLLKTKQLRESVNISNGESAISLLEVHENMKQSKYEVAKKDLLQLQADYESKPYEKESLLETYQYLIHTYAHLNKPDSVSHYTDKLAKLQNEILEASISKQTNELEAKYQTEKKEKLLLQKDIEAKQKNILLIGVSFLSIIIALIGFMIYRHQKLKTKQQSQEFQLKMAISKVETQNKLQEQRLEISKDLHDNIGAQLTFIISSVDNIKYAFDITNSKLNEKLNNISLFAKTTIVELRDTIWAMNHSEITFEDLQARISNFIEKAKEAKEQINFNFTIEPALCRIKLTSVEGMNVYRIIQEAINNSIKYASASEISIEVKKVASKIQIKIQDNGIGFDESTIEKGNGLTNMQERIEVIGGEFNLASVPKKGTNITVILKK